ncbi:hypothetical protein EDD85DRAFT_118571 [Armillaria nabsnona]|nr:hypothetical protein EDD85DRAFT_118571 [Armillaria nabsnona]
MVSNSGERTLRTTSNMLKPKRPGFCDQATSSYAVPSRHTAAFNVVIFRYDIDPVNIRSLNGRVVPMGSGAEKVVGGALCMFTFKLKHFMVSSAHRESFNATLESIRILVPPSDMKKTIKEIALLSPTQLTSPSPFARFLSKSTAIDANLPSCSRSEGPFLLFRITINVP